ncbi:MAG: indole-3-glycerol phosphate synthase TrpC, partial [Armatimonadota bacterium]|nr:indole-3-glycerol phosphate synthase TrpC [Armatimonadota bacterium]MDR7511745.1 indole-3-glycerol phosphate synthase TrpC [Armatimonadota bacterium]
ARDFAAALAGPPLRIIAEIKRASPAAGAIRLEADPAAVARAYEAAGADAISVLTDHRFFAGSPDDLRAARAAVGVPVLRKDFIVDAYQVYEARALGADAVLLVAGTVPTAVLAELVGCAASLGMAALVEAHTEDELDQALAAGARVVGINNRNLHTLAVDPETTARLRPRVPEGVVVVSESGIETPADVARARRAGVHAVLVGTALMASADPAARLRELARASTETGGLCG